MAETTFARIEEKFLQLEQKSTNEYDLKFNSWASERNINSIELMGETVTPGQCSQQTGTTYYEGGDQQADTVLDQVYDDRN